MEKTFLPNRASLFVDAHVHFYDCFSDQLFFESANANFERAAAETGDEAAFGCLCLTECATDHFFRRLAESLEVDAPEWTIRRSKENVSLLACRQDQPRIFSLQDVKSLHKRGWKSWPWQRTLNFQTAGVSKRRSEALRKKWQRSSCPGVWEVVVSTRPNYERISRIHNAFKNFHW